MKMVFIDVMIFRGATLPGIKFHFSILLFKFVEVLLYSNSSFGQKG